MDSSEETSPVETTGRRTRSGRCSLPLASKPAGRKTRKKMVLVEVEVSDEEDGEITAVKETNNDEKQSKPSGKGRRSKDLAVAEKVEIDETPASSDVTLENERIEESDPAHSDNEKEKENVKEKEKEKEREKEKEKEEEKQREKEKEKEIEKEKEKEKEMEEEKQKEIEKEKEKEKAKEKEREKEEEQEEEQEKVYENESVHEETELTTLDDVQQERLEVDAKNGIEENHTVNNIEDDELENKDQLVEQMEVDEDDVSSEKINSDVALDSSPEPVKVEKKEEKLVEDEDVCMQELDAEEAEEEKKVTKMEEGELQEQVEDQDVVDTDKLETADSKQILPADPDAENISEDELPTVQVAKVPETEEVSDEELPGPKRAELPADTEVVSEDELPAVKKEGTKRKIIEGDYDPGSPTSENEVSPKKPFLELEVEKEKEKPEKPKKLPELDKYWKAVNDDPTDFTGWTYLLQYVDQENDMEAAREAYDAFLSHYPYCYGYWRKYADYEKRKGNKKKCEEVFERGLKAIPLSVDLWIHYLTYVRTSKPDDEEFIRSQFERALGACGLEFRSDRLWDSYIKWESDGKRLQQVTAIYDRLLTTPTQGYTTHFDNFQEHVTSNPPNKILEVDEFLALRKEVKHMLKHDVTTEPADNPDVPPGEDREEISTDEETKAIRERIISIRRKIHKNTVTAVTGRWNFEEGIKRPYFHVKPLERCQLKNWQEYLDYEIGQGDQTRIIVLFERCLIACALYEEFWLRFVHFLEGLKDPELHSKIKDVYERACTIHHIKKPSLHLQWAMFEESIKNYTKAAEILVNLEKSVPNILQVAYRRINLERRRDDFEKCSQLYEHYISNAKNKSVSTNLAIKYARFTLKIMKESEKAIEILNSALAKDGTNSRLYLQLIDLSMQKDEVKEEEVIGYLDAFLEKENVDADQKVLFAQRKLEFLEDFGSDIHAVQKAYEEYQKCVKASKEMKKKEPAKGDATSIAKKDKNPPLPSSQANSYANYGNYGNSSGAASAYQYSGSQQGQYNYSQYGQNEQYQYGNWQYPQSGYSGYNQWSGYSGGYGY